MAKVGRFLNPSDVPRIASQQYGSSFHLKKYDHEGEFPMVNRIISIDIYEQLGWSQLARKAVAEGSQLLAT